MVPVTTSDVNSDGTTMINGASAGSRQRSCGSQHACLCSIAQAVLEQSCSAAQHAGECQYSTARSTRARSSCVRSYSSAHSPARPPLSLSAADTGQVIVCMYVLVLVVCMLCTAHKREYRPFYGA